MNILRHIVEPGFFGSGPVHLALAVGTVVAITSAVTGVFTVTRGQSFAGHSLADIATTGGSGAFLVGLNQFWGYLAFGAGAAAFMEMVGIQRRRGRDVATGVVLGAASAWPRCSCTWAPSTAARPGPRSRSCSARSSSSPPPPCPP